MSASVAEQLPTILFDEVAKPFNEAHEYERKSFDVLASVHMMRTDRDRWGAVRPETRERVRDEELSLLVEGVDRAACTEFMLKREGSDLAYYKNGKWVSYTAMLLEGREVAHAEAAIDSRKQFLADDSVNDLAHGLKMRSLQPGEQYVWASPYRHDVEALYGKEFMVSCGRFPERQMGFIYRAVCDGEGNIVLQSHTLDRSDNDAFAAALATAEANPNADTDDLVNAYDDVLSTKHGGTFFAGRRGVEVRENAWETVLAQRDLIDFFLNRLEVIANGQSEGMALENEVKRHMYGVWAAFKNRLDGKRIPQSYAHQSSIIAAPLLEQARLQREVSMAFMQFAREGKVMTGCGGSINVLQGQEDILNAETADVFSAIFGNKNGKLGEDEYGPLVFKCTQGHTNRREPHKLLKTCQISGCKTGSVGCK